MPNNNQTTVTLTVNGQQAQTTLDTLRAKAERLSKELETARGKDFKRLQKEFNQTTNQINQMQNRARTVADTLARIETASPKQLRATLKELNRELNNTVRGTEAWNAAASNIRRVQQELDRVNATIRATNNANNGINLASAIQNPLAAISGINPAFAAATAAATALAAGIRNAYMQYVELDRAMAETRKFTGLTRQQVKILNDEFKALNAAVPTQQLHAYAQEAGRLGIVGTQNILQYVRAAQQIDVALQDLGEGATQTIAQLGDIFKITPDLGVEKSMLAIGSTVNVLSQNCAASKAPIVEFTTRLAGIGQQAGLSIAQIMAFGAALDKNKLNVEASSSAVAQLLQKMYQDPAKIAKAAGMDIQQFSKILREDANAALLMYLERIRELGSKDGMAALAPIFKEAGTNGIRLAQTISTLANELDFVKEEQQVANNAFREAVSVTNEYNIAAQTATSKITRMKNAWYDFGSTIGNFVAPIIEWALTDITNSIRKLDELFNGKNPYLDETKYTVEELQDLEQVARQRAANINKQIADAQKAVERTDLSRKHHREAENWLKEEKRNLEKTLKDLAWLEQALEKRNPLGARSSTPADNATQIGAQSSDNATQQPNMAANKETIEAAYKKQQALIDIAYARGEITHQQHTERLLQAEIDYYTQLSRLTDNKEHERLQYIAKAEQARAKLIKASQTEDINLKELRRDEEADYRQVLDLLEIDYINGLTTQQQYERAKEQALLNHLQCMVELTEEGSRERLEAETKYELESAKIQKRYRDQATKDTEQAWQEAQNQRRDWSKSFLTDKAKQALSDTEKGISAVANAMGNIFSELQQSIEAQTQVTKAKINTIYDSQLRAAEGNKNKEIQIEQQRQAELAKIENEANQRMFAMQVTQAIAQTAQSAISAYSSAAAVPYVGFLLAPMAAAAAVAAGALQIANIKKQQAAAQAQGYAAGGYVTTDYAAGGYTPHGAKNTPAGVVHAGEWVAPQTMVQSPATAPIIANLENIRRTNRLANATTVAKGYATGGYVTDNNTTDITPTLQTLTLTVQNLQNRLNEPFVTINTVSGDLGIQQAQQRYNRLQSNKSR